MIKCEAIQAMRNGEKVTHRWFSPNEWMTLTKDGMMLLEDGVVCHPREIWDYRTDSSWDDGYSIFKEVQV